MAALEPLIASLVTAEENTFFKETSRALLESHLTAAAACVAVAPWTQVHCDTLQHTATHCYTLLHTATHCYTLQYTAIQCHTLHHTKIHNADTP